MKLDNNTVLVHGHVIVTETQTHPYNMTYKSIMTVTVFGEEKTKARWRGMLVDVRLEDRRIWRERNRAQCGVEAGVAM